MAKRFADTRLSREKWFRVLSPALKSALRFLFDDCDEAGIWSIDEDAIEFNVGVAVTVGELVSAVNADGKVRLELLGRDKIYIPGFVPFQYGKLSESCKPHKKAIARLRDLNLWERYLESLGYPFQRDKEEEEDKEEDKEEEKEKGGVGENKIPFEPTQLKPSPKLPPSEFVHDAQPLDASELDLCYQAWLETLAFYKAGRAKLLPAEQLEIVRTTQRQGNATAVLYALRGARYEPKSERFNPADFLKINRVLDPEHFNRFMNLGIQAEHKKAGGT